MADDELDTFGVLNEWNLLDEAPRLENFSMKDWKRVSAGVTRAAARKLRPKLGSVHLGLTAGLQTAEGGRGLDLAAPYALMFETLWLPDPIFSFFGRDAEDGRTLLPEAGGEFFSKGGMKVSWQGLWATPPDRRKAFVLKHLPPVLARMRELRGLAEAGAVTLVPWEPLVFDARQELRKHVHALSTTPTVIELSQRFLQQNYNLGVRVGAIGVAMGKGNGPGWVEGAPMWMSDKAPMVLVGLMNATLSATYGASFAPDLAGDRAIYDFLISGAKVDPPARSLARDPLVLPRFGAALLPDLVAVRKDAETLKVMRDVVTEAAGVDEAVAIDGLRERLHAAAAKVREDASLTKVFGKPSAEFAISTVASGLTAVALGAAAPAAAALSAAGGAVAYLALRAKAAWGAERREKVARAELITSITDRL